MQFRRFFGLKSFQKSVALVGANALKYWYGKESSYDSCIREISTLFLSDYRLCRLKCFGL